MSAQTASVEKLRLKIIRHRPHLARSGCIYSPDALEKMRRAYGKSKLSAGFIYYSPNFF